MNKATDCDYDKIAETYENLFNDDESIRENNIIASLLHKLRGEVLDIGCGSGLFAEITSLQPRDYTGIDPSQKMLNIFAKNHPTFANRIKKEWFSKETTLSHFHSLVSLFGSISYVDRDAVEKISSLDNCKQIFLMFYAPTYVPVTYEKTNVFFNHNIYTKDELKCMFKNSCVFSFNNYLIVSNL